MKSSDKEQGAAMALPDRAILAQMDEIRKRIPLLYSVLIANTIFLAMTHYGAVSPVMALYLPAILIAAMGSRLVYWLRAGQSQTDLAQARRTIRHLNILSGVLGIALLGWALALYHEGAAVSSTGLPGRAHVILFISLTVMSCIFLLMHVRAAALIVTATVIPAFSLYLFLQGAIIETAVAINLLMVTAAMLYVLLTFARDFRKMVRTQNELREIGEENARLAAQDAATGMPNRRRFFGALNDMRARKAGHAVIVIDLDGFKQVNDLYGHVVGDEVLREIGARISMLAPVGGLAARLGGDEFAVLLTGSEAGRMAMPLATRIAESARVPVMAGHISISIGASAGVSISGPDDGENVSHYEWADYALYQAKQSGRGHVELFSQDHAIRIHEQSRMEYCLRNAPLAEEIHVLYQPIFSSADQTLISYEALARWENEQCGAISPADFIPVAERTGLILDITRIVLRTALIDASKWDSRIGLKVNLSVRDLIAPKQMLSILDIVRASGFDPRRLTFEITETAFAENLALVETSVQMLRSAGCDVAVDDFGVSYSSLQYIHRLTPAVIKIDKCFIDRLPHDHVSLGIVKTIIELARNVGARSVAEGVETPRQVRILKTLGCDELQGYFFSRPISHANVLAFSAPAANSGQARQPDIPHDQSGAALSA